MENTSTSHQKVRDYLKVLLLHLAAKSETPAEDLQNLLREVLTELHDEVKSSLRAKNHLKLVSQEGVPVSAAGEAT